jgi:signal transduction histidine kinase
MGRLRAQPRIALRNDAEHILLAAARDMRTDQTDAERASKSKGHGGAGGEASDRLDNASAQHGIARVGSGFDIREVVSEYRALRASVLRQWRHTQPAPDERDIDDITRFNEAIDQSLAQAVASYSKRVDQSRQMFLAILGHDLRSPLNCIRMATQLVSDSGPTPDAADAVRTIDNQTQVITRLVTDLLDFSSVSLGNGIPLTRQRADLAAICRDVIDGLRTTHPGRTIRFDADPDSTGHWDAGRLRQVVANLLGNALQHGSPEGPVSLTLRTDPNTVTLTVHNTGEPIPHESLATVFDPLVRQAQRESPAPRVAGSMGLGLYIVREVLHAHHGTIDVASTPGDGTTFIARLPRQ